MNSALPGRHPGDDVLADLAAEVLPETQARTVEAHVIGCPRCAELLADAESVRRLLVTDDPGPMPLEVLARIESALQAEATARATGVDHLGGLRAPSGAVRTDPPVGADPPWERDWAAETGLQAATIGAPPARLDRPGRVSRPVRPGGGGPRNRRDARPERPAGFLRRKAVVLMGAAAALAVVSVAGVTVSRWGPPANTAASMASPASAQRESAGGGGAFGRVRFVSSRSEYTPQNLAAQASKVLVPAADATASVGASKSVGVPGPAFRLEGPAQALQDTGRLSACIGALNRDDVPLAVDFARYQNREAAIVLLPARDGGYEVWAVDPTCGPDGSGVLGFSTLPAR